jgi:hypothetical protein
VTGEGEEPNRVLGFPRRTGPAPTDPVRRGPLDGAPSSGSSEEEEPQRVLGIPVDLFDTLRERFRALLRRPGRLAPQQGGPRREA